MTTAKALGGGLPIGACITGERASQVLARGDHGSTFAGGPLVSAAALAAFSVLEDPELLRNVRELGGRLRRGLEALGPVAEVRGRGLMLGARLEGKDASEAASELLAQGLVVNPIRPDTLRFLPPLIVEETEVDDALAIVGKVLASA
jgi:acetylornithine/N-succinyldiaminopimelate aminotransferase